MKSVASADSRTLIIAAAAVAISFASGLWSLVNPRGDLAEIKRDYVTEKQHHIEMDNLTSDMQRLVAELKELRITAVPRELFSWRVDQFEKVQNFQRERLQKLDETVNVTYSAKDALQQIQNRLADLERAARGTKP